MRPVWRAVVGLGVVAGLVGCSSPQPAEPTAASTTAAPSPTPTPTTVDYSNAELGIVFEDEPQWAGDAAAVYHWAALYETEYWRTLTTNTVSPAFTTMASPEVQAWMQQIADTNGNLQAEVGGVFRVDVRDVVVEGDSASVIACLDYADATFADPNGSYTPDQVGFGGVSHQELTFLRVDADAWIVQTSTVEGKC